MDTRNLLRRATRLVFDPLSTRKRRYFFLQSTLASMTLMLVLFFEDALANVAVLTAVVSTTFPVFVSTRSVMASPRRVIGGHFVAVLTALLVSSIVHDSPVKDQLDSSVARDAGAAIGVGLAMMVMAFTDTEHGPDAGTVLGLILEP